jgi:chitin synthase
MVYMTPLVTQHAATDLASLSSISDDVIVICLHEHFMTDIIYSIGFPTCIAVNPHKYVASNADSILQKYATDY